MAAQNVGHNIERYSGPPPMQPSYSRSSSSSQVVNTKSFAQQLYASSVAAIPGRAPDPPPEPTPRSRDTSPPIPVTELPRALPNGTPSRSRPGTAGSASNSATAATQLVTNVSSVNPSRRPSSHLHTLKIGQIVGHGDEPSFYGTAISSSNRQSFHPGKNTSFGGRIVSGPRAIGEGPRPPIRRPATSPSNRSSTYSFGGLESVHERQASAPAIPYPSGSSSVPHSRHQSTYDSLPSLSVRGLSPQSTGQTESPISPVASSVSLSPQVERRPDITPAAPLRTSQRPISVISTSSYSSLPPPPPPPPLPTWSPRPDPLAAAPQPSRLSSPPIQANGHVASPPTHVSQNPFQPPQENGTQQRIAQTMSTPQTPAQHSLQHTPLVPVRAQDASTSSSASGNEERERPRKLRKRGQPQPASVHPPIPVVAPPPPSAVQSTSDASPRLQPQRRAQTNPSEPSFRNSVFSLTSDTSSRADVNRPRKLRKPTSQQPPLPLPTLPVMLPEETSMTLTPLSRAPTPPPPPQREPQRQIPPQPRHASTVPNPRTQERPTSGHASLYGSQAQEAATSREYLPTPPVTRHSSAIAVPPVPPVSSVQTQTQSQSQSRDNVPRYSSADIVASQVSSAPQSRQPLENVSTPRMQTQRNQYQTYPEFEYSSSMAAAAAAAAASPSATTRTTTSLARSTTSATVPPYQDFGLPPPPAGAAPAYYAISQSPEQDPSLMNDQLGFEFEPLGDPYIPLYGDHVDGTNGSGNRGGESPPRSAAPAYQLFSPQETVQEEEVGVPMAAANGGEYGGRSEEGQDLPRGAAPAYHDGFSQGLGEEGDGTGALQENTRYNNADAPLPSPLPTAAPAYQDLLHNIGESIQQTGSPDSQSRRRRESALPSVPTSAAPAYQDPSLDDAGHSQLPPSRPRRSSNHALPSPPTSAAPAYQDYVDGERRQSHVSQTPSQGQRGRALPAPVSAAPAYDNTSLDTRYSRLPPQTPPQPRLGGTDALPSVPSSAAPAYREHSRHAELPETPPQSQCDGEGSPPPPPKPSSAAPAYQQSPQSGGQGSGSSQWAQTSPGTQYNAVPSPPVHARSSVQTPQSQHQSQPSTSPSSRQYGMNAPVYQERGNAQNTAQVHQRSPAQRAQTQYSQSPQFDADAPLPLPPLTVTSAAPAYAQHDQSYPHGASDAHERQTPQRTQAQLTNVVQERYYNPNASLPPPPPPTTSTAPTHGQQGQHSPQNTAHAHQRPVAQRAQTQPASVSHYDPNSPLPPPPPPISAAPAYVQHQQRTPLPPTQQQQQQSLGTSPPTFHRAQTAPAPAPRSTNNMGRTVLAGLGGAAVGLLGAAALNNVINGGNGGGIDPSSFDMSGLTDGINGIIGGGGDSGMGGDGGGGGGVDWSGGGDSGMGDYSQFDPSQSGGDPSQFNGDPSQDPWDAGQDQGQQQQDSPDQQQQDQPNQYHEQMHHLQHAAHAFTQHHHHAAQGNQQGGGLLGALFGKPQKPNKPQNSGGGFLGALFGRPNQANVHQQYPQTQQYHPQVHHQQQQHPHAVNGQPGRPNANGQNSAGQFNHPTGQYRPNGGQQYNPHAGGHNQHP
ncbi:hypothetical protein BD410DRAFT_3902 [Rickenella mellea]|uniref:Uncharacterized protein n=1 Tax=Rickenella mellea TaxID=50990 RepID=A0A4R5XEX0_9AGAM|nr:hypothetical protein BD410DRAFT_3902 [Rickenella mellea]